MAIGKNMSEGSVFKNLILFSLPFLASNIVQSLYNVADMLIVGNFCGAESVSGVNIGGQITFILTHVIVGLCVGATVLIGQYTGTDNKEALKKVTSTLITLLVILAFGISAFTLIFKVPLLNLIRTPAESFAESNSYLTVTVIGLIFIFGYNALSAILRGMGDSKSPFYFVVAACIVNVGLDLLFVVVFDLKAFGAALATVIAQAMSVLLCIIYMKKKKFHFDFRLPSYKIDKKQLKLIFKVGLPSCVQNGIVSTSFLFITAIVNQVGGVDASAAVGVIGKFNSFAFMPITAVSMSISTLCAQNIGAGKLDRAVLTCKLGTAFAICLSFSFFTFLQVSPETVLIIFGSGPEVIENGITYLRTFCFDFIFIPFIFCFNGLLTGGGHTKFTLITNLLSTILLRVPISYLLGLVFELGLMGVGAAAPIASFGSLLLIIGFLISGKWKRNAIISAHE